MTWFKVDDKFHSSVEVMSIPTPKRAAAIGLWCLAGAWSSDQLKDGYVPVTMLKTWGATIVLADVLVTAKLWTRVGKTGYRFRNWAKWQITRAQVETAREQEAARKKSWRESKAQKSQQTSTDVPDMSPLSRPDPTRPDPTRPLKELKGAVDKPKPVDNQPWCTRHPGGTDTNCGPCRTARLAFEAALKEPKAKPVTSTPKRYKPDDGHKHHVSPGGDRCELCEARIE